MAEKATKKNPKKADGTIEVFAPENLKDNQIYIDGIGVFDIKPTKLKYFVVNKSVDKDKTAIAPYDGAKLVLEMGVGEVLHYGDGIEIVENLVKAILDIPEVDFFEALTTKNINKMIEIANILNEIKSEDFMQKNLDKEMEVIQESNNQ